MKTPVVERSHPSGMGGTQKIYRFPNGYGASVVQFPGSYGYADGLWELAVIQFTGEDIDDFKLTYETYITNDVIGCLNPLDIQALLVRIEKLK